MKMAFWGLIQTRRKRTRKRAIAWQCVSRRLANKMYLTDNATIPICAWIAYYWTWSGRKVLQTAPLYRALVFFGLVLACSRALRLITVYHQQRRTTKEYPFGVRTPTWTHMVVYTLMGVYSLLALPVIYLIPLIERLICRLCFDYLKNCIAWLSGREMIFFWTSWISIFLFYMEGLGGDTIYGLLSITYSTYLHIG